MPSPQTDAMRTFKLGDATITVMNIGDIHYALAPVLNATAEELAQVADIGDLMTLHELPTLDVLIQMLHMSVLVDAGVHDVETVPQFGIPGYTQPPPLVEQLAQIGVAPEQIDSVIITHAHWDHINGTTKDADGDTPKFPNARYYLGAADWADAQPALSDPASLEYRTLRVLDQHGVLVPVQAATTVVEGVEIIPAPGETKGHQIVRIHSSGETLYCLGDLYHHVAEILHPDLMVKWADSETMQRSRALLTERALAENALLMATHIPEIGRLVQSAEGLAWQAVY